ncbi:hypothetical protein [Pseudalkalibacillus salsuginis]|uniref:hypothetical protein n=1 Tax=Pseudalkalibacillus salsuginis TaxID=2910972 RepID=UPI001F39481D|nr:hypothetical protein [Pseudalkalibacillus salsuginis]MCF6411408.1 hypothetical protein [Pseudalkalibacillus salsuginis]
MTNLIKTDANVVEPSPKLFKGEKWLVFTGLIGLLLAIGIAAFILFRGSIILPEGNMNDAFSFNAAIGIFTLSIAAILPLARFSDRKRKTIRWLFIISILYAYAIETVQNFRGLNPRFSTEGSVIDTLAGMLFGVLSLMLVGLTIWLMIKFFRLKSPHGRPFLILGIRYAFLSVLLANLAGICMILLQGRFTGDAGNLIVLHGIGFHALQTLILPAWLLEKAQVTERIKKLLIHYGSIAWMISIALIGFQTALGLPVFEWTLFPVLTGIFLLGWLVSTALAFVFFMKKGINNALETAPISAVKR